MKENEYLSEITDYRWRHLDWMVQCGGINIRIDGNQFQRSLSGDEAYVDIGDFDIQKYDHIKDM